MTPHRIQQETHAAHCPGTVTFFRSRGEYRSRAGLDGEAAMDVKKLVHMLEFCGLAAVTAALFWWASFYGPITQHFGGTLSSAESCIYSNAGACSLASGVAQMVGKTPYNPVLFWVGVVTFGIGVLARLSLKKSDQPPPPSNWRDRD